MQTIYLKAPNIHQPIFKSNPFKIKPIQLLSKPERWRKQADLVNLSTKARLRLEWMILHETAGNHDAYITAKHFGIAPKTFYKWLKRFDNGRVECLEEKSRAPHRTRRWQVALTEEARIVQLRRDHMYYGRKKLQTLYFKEYQKTISCWKIERVIRKHKLYPNPQKALKLSVKRQKAKMKNQIKDLVVQPELWFLLHLDGIIIYWKGLKRFIFTATDHLGKLAYARMYATKSSRVAKDFLYRLHYLIDADIINVQTDEGSEFKGEFDQALEPLQILHWFSRPHTPQDNSVVERFNQTLQYEWLNHGNFNPNLKEFNQALTEWLVEYNFRRPHQSLDYLTPIEYIEKTYATTEKLLPMWSVRTHI